jgi:outer membrane protein TolC
VLLGVGAVAETLDEAWQAALAADQSLAANRARTAAASAELDAARAGYRPVLSTSASTSRWRDTPAFDFSSIGMPVELPLFGGSSVSLADIRAELPIYSGGATDANVIAASAAVLVGEHATDTLVQDVKLGVAVAYVDVLRVQSALGVARANTTSLAAHAADVEDMLRAGQVPRNDYLAAAVALADARQREVDRANALEVAMAAYNRRLGRPLDAPVDLAALAPAREAETQDIDQLVGAALAMRTELMSLDAAATELDARATAVRAARKPQLALTGAYTFIENQVLDREDYWWIGVGVRWMPFDAGRARHAASALQQRSVAAARERDHARSLIELDVRRAWLDAGAARTRVEVTEDAVVQAEENLRVVRDRYRSGEGTNTEVLDAEALRAQSVGNFDNARYDAAVAQFRLSRALAEL